MSEWQTNFNDLMIVILSRYVEWGSWRYTLQGTPFFPNPLGSKFNFLTFPKYTLRPFKANKKNKQKQIFLPKLFEMIPRKLVLENMRNLWGKYRYNISIISPDLLEVQYWLGRYKFHCPLAEHWSPEDEKHPPPGEKLLKY